MSDILQPAEASNWSEWITNFDKSYSVFQTNYAGLLNSKNYIYSKHPELKSEYDALVKRGAEQDAVIQRLRGLRDTVKSWLDGLGGAYQSSVNTVSDWMTSISNFFSGGNNVQGLGVIPVIMGIAAATAALAAIGYWITDAYKFAQKLNAMQALEAKGLTPQEAAKAVANLDNSGSVFGVPIWLIVGAGVLFLVPFIFKRKG